jgi:hypothetical protein
MPEHYTKNTVEVSAWCLKCDKMTMHRVDQDAQQGRLGPCLRCIEALNQLPLPIMPKEPEQLSFPTVETHNDSE